MNQVIERREWRGITEWRQEAGSLAVYTEIGVVRVEVGYGRIGVGFDCDPATAREVAQRLLELADAAEREATVP